MKRLMEDPAWTEQMLNGTAALPKRACDNVPESRLSLKDVLESRVSLKVLEQKVQAHPGPGNSVASTGSALRPRASEKRSPERQPERRSPGRLTDRKSPER